MYLDRLQGKPSGINFTK